MFPNYRSIWTVSLGSLLILQIAILGVSTNPILAQDATFQTTEVASCLAFPSALAITPDGRILFTELKTGKIRIINDGSLQTESYVQLPDATSGINKGMLGLALHPDFLNNPFVYLYHTYKDEEGKAFNRIVRFTDDGGSGIEMLVLLDKIPAADDHNGGIIAFGPDGKLYAATGDQDKPELSQDLNSLAGKILRINPDGTIPDDNPFAGSPILSYGHRNVFGLDFHPVTGKLFATENGPEDNDEINIIFPGGNYGWPKVKGIANDPRFIDPIIAYTPTIGPTNMVFNSGDKYLGEENNLFFGEVNNGVLHRVVLKAPAYDEVLSDDTVLQLSEAIIDVELTPDDLIFLTTPTSIIKVTKGISEPVATHVPTDPPVAVKKGTFTKESATSSTPQVITGVGFQPKALILFTTGQSAEGFNDVYNFAMGFSDGIDSRSIGIRSDDNLATSNTGRAFGTKILTILSSGTPKVGSVAELSSFDNDGFTLNWVQNNQESSIIHYIALGSDNLTAKVGSFAAHTVSGYQEVSNIGFEPDLVMFMHSHAKAEEGNAKNAYMSYGFARSCTEVGTVAVASKDNSSVTHTSRWQRSDRVIIALKPFSGMVDAQASLVSMEPSGFTIDWHDAPANPDQVYYLALKGGNFHVGVFNQPTLGGLQTIDGVDFEPKGLILTSFGAPALKGGIKPRNVMSLGAADASNNPSEGAVLVGDRDDVTDSITARSTSTTEVIRIGLEKIVGGSSLIQAEARLESFNSDGFTLDWTKVDTKPRQLIFVALG